MDAQYSNRGQSCIFSFRRPFIRSSSWMLLLQWCVFVCVCLTLTYGFISCSKGEPCNCCWIMEAGVDIAMGAPQVHTNPEFNVYAQSIVHKPSYYFISHTHTLARRNSSSLNKLQSEHIHRSTYHLLTHSLKWGVSYTHCTLLMHKQSARSATCAPFLSISHTHTHMHKFAHEGEPSSKEHVGSGTLWNSFKGVALRAHVCVCICMQGWEARNRATDLTGMEESNQSERCRLTIGRTFPCAWLNMCRCCAFCNDYSTHTHAHTRRSSHSLPVIIMPYYSCKSWYAPNVRTREPKIAAEAEMSQMTSSKGGEGGRVTSRVS